ncbi:MAG: SCO family protein [SAR86 cluster bacterium]|nr:SCO family protein [SAR86 cluster bacterium]
MKRNIRHTILICILIMSVALGLFVNKVLTPKNLSIEEFKDLGVYLREPARNIRDFELINTENKPFSQEDFIGNWNLIFFGFSFCPDICPITMSLLAKVQSSLETDEKNKVDFFMVTVDPARDSPAALRMYLDNFSKTFIGLTGTLDQIYNFSTQVNAPFSPVLNQEGSHYTVDHSGNIILINPEGKLAGIFKMPHDQKNITVAISDLINRKY